MFTDILHTLRKWRVIHLIGVSALRARYARSVFGQFWLTITALVNIVVIGVVWSLLWRRPVNDFLPYYGAGQILFAFIAANINESTGCLSSDAQYYLTDKTPFMLSVFAILYRNVLLLFHQLPIVAILIAWSTAARFDAGPLFLPAVACTLAFCVFASYMVAVVCARFRDLRQLVHLVMQNLFLLSPVIWQTDIIPERFRPLLYVNPIACVLETLRNPVVGLPAGGSAYLGLLLWTIIAGLCAKFVHARWNKVIIFWI